MSVISVSRREFCELGSPPGASAGVLILEECGRVIARVETGNFPFTVSWVLCGSKGDFRSRGLDLLSEFVVGDGRFVGCRRVEHDALRFGGLHEVELQWGDVRLIDGKYS